MALWDLLGKRDGKSLKEMFGGKREQVEVGVSIGIQESAAALVGTVESYLQKGYARVKIKIKPGREVEETVAVRNAYPNLRLQVDANSAYTLESAQGLKQIDHLNLLLIEQPLFEDDIWDHRLLQADFKTPIRGYWQCGSGTHPGGGITSGPGRLAALEILRGRN